MTEPSAEPGDETLEIGGLRIQPSARLGPYVYKRLVGKGGMAHVVLATDPDGRPVALKVLKASRMGSGLTRFKREFRALARLRHPNVIRVEAYGDIHGHPYIAMEYVEGTDLHTTIHGFRALRPAERWRRCEEVLVDLCRALAYIHRRGLVHRDLKPSNVLIDHERRCKLTDFGIVKDLDPNNDTMVSTTLVGTWAYASPEQMQGLPIDHRSDLYSLGVILFAMLTGRRPFVAKDLAGYLELHRTHDPPRPRDIDPQVPEHLDEICDRLLRKSPRDRFRSAQEILYRLEQADALPEVEPRGAWKPPLVGRAEEEEALRERIAALTSRQGGTVVVAGGEGSGRSRMLDVAEANAMLIGLLTLRGRLEARDGAIGAIVRLGEGIRGELGPQRAPASLTPALAAFSAEGEGPPGDARERLYDAVGEGLATLLDEGPVVLLFDDLHLARLPTLDALAALQRRFADAPLLLVATVVSDRMTPRLQAFCEGMDLPAPPLRVALPPLQVEAIEDLVAGLVGAGRPATALAARLHRETQGNPLFVTLFLQHLMGQGVLMRADDRGRNRPKWRLALDVEEIAGGHFEIPPGVRQVVRARLAPLTAEQREVCEALAVHGPQMELDTLLDVLDVDEDAVSDDLDALDDAGILVQRRRMETVTLDFAHSKFGDVTYRELSLEARATLHGRIAQVLEARHLHHAAGAEVVGEHYRRAGDARKAWLYLVTAAARLRDRSLYGEAGEIAQRAMSLHEAARVEMAPAEHDRGLQELYQILADIHIAAAEWPEARDDAEQAVSLGPHGADDGPTLRARLTLTRVLRATDDLGAAEAEAVEALASARALGDTPLLCEALRVRAGVAWTTGDIDATDALTREGLSLARGPELAETRGHLLLARGSLQLARGLLPQAAATLTEAEAVLRDLHLKPFQAAALASRALVAAAQGRLGAAWRDAVHALEMGREASHRYAETLARTAIGTAALAVGHLSDAQAELEVAHVRSTSLRLVSDAAGPALLLARVRLARGDVAGTVSLLDDAQASLAGGDPERLRTTIQAVRCRALALGPDPGRAAPLLVSVRRELTALPALRAAEAGVDLAVAALALGRDTEAEELSREAAATARTRGAAALLADALGVQARAASTREARKAAESAWEALLPELERDLPERWRVEFWRKVGRSRPPSTPLPPPPP